MKTKPLTRNANLELLRIVCMFMIVFAHCIGHGGIVDATTISVVNHEIILMLRTLISVLINCFVLISGYFLSQSEFKLRKWLELWLSSAFWSVVLAVICMASGAVPFSFIELAKAFLPFTQQQYWFVTTYLLMYLLVPFLNAAIHNLTQKQYLFFLIVTFIAYFVLQNIVFWRDFTLLSSHSPFFFAYLYMIAAYIRRFPSKKSHWWLLGYVLCCVGARLSDLLIKAVAGPLSASFNATAYNSVLIIMASICLFMTFLSMEIKSAFWTKIILTVSSLTFGVYLIHDNNHIRSVLWRSLFDPEKLAANPFVVPIVIGISVMVFLACLPLEALRKKIFSICRLSKLCAWGESIIYRIIDWIYNCILGV